MRTFEVDVRITQTWYGTITVEVEDTPDAIQRAKDAAVERYWDEGDEAVRHGEVMDTDVEVPALEGREVIEL